MSKARTNRLFSVHAAVGALITCLAFASLMRDFNVVGVMFLVIGTFVMGVSLKLISVVKSRGGSTTAH